MRQSFRCAIAHSTDSDRGEPPVERNLWFGQVSPRLLNRCDRRRALITLVGNQAARTIQKPGEPGLMETSHVVPASGDARLIVITRPCRSTTTWMFIP